MPMNNMLLTGTGVDRRGQSGSGGDRRGQAGTVGVRRAQTGTTTKKPVSKINSLNSNNRKLNKTNEFEKIVRESVKQMPQYSHFKTFRLTHEILEMCKLEAVLWCLLVGRVVAFTGRPCCGVYWSAVSSYLAVHRV